MIKINQKVTGINIKFCKAFFLNLESVTLYIVFHLHFLLFKGIMSIPATLTKSKMYIDVVCCEMKTVAHKLHPYIIGTE